MAIQGSGWGGTKEQTYLVTKGLKEKGVDVHIALSSEFTEMIEKLKPYEVPMHFYEDLNDNGKFNIRQHKRLANILDKENFDVVVANSPKTFDYALMAYLFTKNKPTPKLISMKRSGKRSSWFSKVFKYQFADKIVVVSEGVTEQMRKDNFLPEKLITIPSGIPTDRFRPNPENRTALRKKLGIEDSKHVFINVANWNPKVKAQDKLLEAFSQVKNPNTILVMAGYQSDTTAKEYAEELGIANQFIGLGYREDIPALLDMADYYVLSSNLEGIAGSVLQAMIMGKIALSTLAGGIGSYLKDGENGFTVPVGDFTGLTKKMKHIVQLSQVEKENIIRKSMNTGNEYAIDNTTDKYMKLFDSMLTESK